MRFRYSVVESELLSSGREGFSRVDWAVSSEAGEEIGEGEVFVLHKLVGERWKIHRSFSASPPPARGA